MTPTADSARDPNDVPIMREALVPGAIRDVFDFVAAEDVLPRILTGYGLLPGISHTSDITGPWDQPGSRRIVHLLDGSHVREGVTHYDRPDYFAYRVSDPSFALKHLMVEARGEFRFAETDRGTEVRWTYTFRARNRLARLPLRLFVGTQWKGYMDVCMTNIIAHFAPDRTSLAPGPSPVARSTAALTEI
ncbi:SRPBCC family protein [Stakelama pacifica]|uniref:Polyketide cyclase/dehydrase/lipid transport protein n=1 Tax=Stakelama pacifica TaxID=517720 RepID=A0A4R6FP43_9SPHN|nr:SRPBCC family protein [Stakelama pacifica]TDN82830.1 polyketide cyclase/dehydrase/lipid transport protein [Stakelama pacifica]GGO95469.1 hypothetical protein GCM10011329_19730 [Stakelama pacifica]